MVGAGNVLIFYLPQGLEETGTSQNRTYEIMGSKSSLFFQEKKIVLSAAINTTRTTDK